MGSNGPNQFPGDVSFVGDEKDDEINIFIQLIDRQVESDKQFSRFGRGISRYCSRVLCFHLFIVEAH